MAKKEQMMFDGKPIFVASNSKMLKKKVAAYDGKAEAPYVVMLPEGVTEVKADAFWCDLTVGWIILPESVERIGLGAFFGCTNLVHVSIPGTVKTIEQQAFGYCQSLKNLFLPASVTELGMDVFEACSGLLSIKVAPENPVYDSREDCNAIIETATDMLLYGCRHTIIPNSVETIGPMAFYDCEALAKIEFPSSVKLIGALAFAGTGLKKAMMPHVSLIEYDAFYGCSDLKAVTISQSAVVEEYAFDGCEKLKKKTVV